MITRRSFIYGLGIACGGMLAACSNELTTSDSSELETTTGAEDEGSEAPETQGESAGGESMEAVQSNSIVVYFSHVGENYRVGVIEEGNTAILAKMIAEKTDSDLFEVVPAVAYPEGYDECCDVALDEKNSGSRPEFAGSIDLSEYDTVYLGYPIWWGDLPMVMYTFIESQDWTDKTVRPFSTHQGSGLAGTVQTLASICSGATVLDGLSMTGETAQNSRSEAEALVDEWL